ncbi:MAG: GNAT family N-acetyltransferase [Clostridia bacterium]|nr:GNAT family N-acetyltransferase [Clostridia bacterium]
MTVRKAETADIPHLMRLLHQVLDVHHQGRPDLFRGGVTKYTEDELAALLADERTPVFVADNGETVCGYAFCVMQQHVGHNIFTDVATLYIDDLCVDEQCRGRHIGQTLYEYVLDYARAAKCYNVTLNVWACNESALRFYEAQGLTPQKIGMERIL